MKQISIFLLLLFFGLTVSNTALAVEPVPMAVSFADESTNIPPASFNYLTAKLKSAITHGGMGSTDNFTQFYLTCSYNVVEKHIVPGAPTKYYETIDMNYYIVDAFAGKIFSSSSIQVSGVGNSEEQANMAAIKQLSSTNKTLVNFISSSSSKIVTYYDEHYNNIITQANTLAAAHQYGDALFQLSLVPEACSCYPEILKIANTIYKKYIDYQAARNLALATTIWNAGQNSDAALEAGPYLAQILPDAACYKDAVKLNNEIKARIKSDIDYVRKVEHQETMARIDAWKAIGVAIGNGQKDIHYHKSFL